MLYYSQKEGRKTRKNQKGTETMKKLNVNEWMEMDMIGYLFFAVYAISENEWWILGRADTLEDARAKLENEMMDAEEDDDGEWFIIDREGKRVEG